ncbi:hypothetical protein GCM10022243_08420 [Saccharothrix violaceirubra]|uniref:Uncharacterized protein n=1 Tax=Saccharothrix violaceirubra TaxID=413306 RepID=A0A7W7SYJ6_9PSEU|nr:hypothetical protein [Saccharothrix violaceirubra]MBB4963254.1 hypothetical protein [Saccharothrix violaceirubra]
MAYQPSSWAVSQFGDQTHAVVHSLVRGLNRAQRARWLVQRDAHAQGVLTKRAYGSLWDTPYHSVIEELGLENLDGYRVHHPYGASYDLAMVGGRVLVPFKLGSRMPLSPKVVTIATLVPQRTGRRFGVEPPAMLFDLHAPARPTVADAVAAAGEADLTVIYVGFVANADSDRVLGAWWGEPISLADDGTLTWEPERLPLDLDLEDAPQLPLTGFAEGDEPELDVTRHPDARDA